MLFDTHKMLRRFRDAGYTVGKKRDSEGNTVWHIYYWNSKHGALKYLGVVTCLNPYPVDVGEITLCFGRPWFWLNTTSEEDRNSEHATIAANIANQSRRGGLHQS